MSDAYVVETASRTAGVAVREGSSFRFYAAGRPFLALDQRLFPRLKELRRAVDAVEEQAPPG